MEKERIYCFDFDGTLTRRDTLIAFIVFARGWFRLFLGFGLYAPLLLLMKCGLLDNGRMKERIFALYFKGMSISRFNDCCTRFAIQATNLWRPSGVQAVRKALDGKHRVLVVSASVDNWVSACFAQAGLYGVEVLGTLPEVVNGRLTGRFATPNCYGEEKVRRIQDALLMKPRETYHITAYGDSRGDKAMLTYADEAFYKPFE